MREVTTMSQIQPQEGIAWVQNCQQHGCIGLCAGVRLHVGPLCIEDLFQSLDSDRLALIHYLATAIITLARVTLGILVGQAAAHGLHHLVADKILGSDQLNAFQLTLVLLLNDVKNNVVSFHYDRFYFAMIVLNSFSVGKNFAQRYDMFLNRV